MIRSCYLLAMLKIRISKTAAEAERAVQLLEEVTTSIGAVGDEDLLDLADIFSSNAKTLRRIASVDMQRRSLNR